MSVCTGDAEPEQELLDIDLDGGVTHAYLCGELFGAVVDQNGALQFDTRPNSIFRQFSAELRRDAVTFQVFQGLQQLPNRNKAVVTDVHAKLNQIGDAREVLLDGEPVSRVGVLGAAVAGAHVCLLLNSGVHYTAIAHSNALSKLPEQVLTR